MVKNRSSESVQVFMKIFKQLYNNIPNEIKPTPITAMVNYVVDFKPYLSVMVRER